MTWIFLHGLGQAPRPGSGALRRLEPELTVHCPSLSELAAGDPRYPALLSALETAQDSIPGAAAPLRAVPGRCAGDGLRPPPSGAGGLAGALRYSAHHAPESAAAAGFPVPPDAGTGLCRQRLQPEAMRQLAGSMAELDLRPRLPELSCPVLVLCGSKDRANRKAAGNWQNNCPRPGCTGSPEPDMKPTWIRRK